MLLKLKEIVEREEVNNRCKHTGHTFVKEMQTAP